jgi:hypothetical protein
MNRMCRRVSAALVAVAVLALTACPNPLFDAIKAKVANEESKSIGSFGFTAATNLKLYTDVTATVDEAAHLITVTVPKWVPLDGLVASFEFKAASVTVNGVAQASGVTPNDFSAPVTYTVTPTSGAPVQYTITATSGAQGLLGGVIQGTPLALTGAVTTVAGKAAPFGSPAGVVLVGTSLYVADSWYNVIWKVDTSSGAMSVFAGAIGETGSTDGIGSNARFYGPDGLATNGTTLYVADRYNSTVRSIDLATAAVTTLAGSPGAYGLQDGIGAAAQLGAPSGLAINGNTLYLTDADYCTVHTIDLTTKQVTRIAGSGLIGGADNANGLFATFKQPAAIVYFASNPSLYVADSGNHKIRQVSTAVGNEVITFAGNGTAGWADNGTGISAEFNTPTGLAIRASTMYVADKGNHVIRAISLSTSGVTTQAGVAGQAGLTDGFGAANMRFNTPYMLCVATSGSPYAMYVSEAVNLTVRTVMLPTNFSSTFAGGPPAGSADGVGAAARFNVPRMLSTNGSVLWIGDYLNQTVRGMDLATAAVSTIAGQVGAPGTSDGIGTAAQFNNPYGMTSDGKSLFICDTYGMTIRRMDLATGNVTTFAGSASGYADGIGAAARFNRPTGITTDGTYLYVTDYLNHAIRRIEIATATVLTIAGSPPSLGAVLGDADDPSPVGGLSTASRFRRPIDVTTDGTNLYITDSQNSKIRKIVIATGVVSTLAGPAPGTLEADYVNGSGAAARFSTPIGITTDGTFLYVADLGNYAVRQIMIATAQVTTLCGSPEMALPLFAAYGGADGTGTAARFNGPFGITTDGVGLYVSDEGGNTIRLVR